MTMGQIIKKLTVPLVVICLVCSFLVAYAHDATKAAIEKKAADDTKAAYAQVLPAVGDLTKEKIPAFSKENLIKDVECSKKDGKVNGYIYTVTPSGYGGPLDLMVGIGVDGKITGIKVLQHSETPGLGAKSTEPAFPKEFVGKDTKSEIKVTKSASPKADEIKAITAATITSRAVTKGVNICREHYVKNYAGKKG
jgi:electron transport complex protein RnfG